MKLLKWAAVAGLIVALIVCGIAIVQYQRAINQWQAEAERLQTLAVSDYYRGVLSSCVGIGIQMQVPRELVTSTCSTYWRKAYTDDWYHELQTDSWTWPPETQIKALGKES